MTIANYWSLPPAEQTKVRTSNPKTKCNSCGKETIRLVSCDACGESVCYACAIPCATVTMTKDGLDGANDTVLCTTCVGFQP